MRIQGKLGSRLFVFLLALAGGGAQALGAAPNAPMASAAAHSTHTSQTLPAALRPVFYQALAKDAGAAYHINRDGCAVLPKQRLAACFDRGGVHFTNETPLSLHLVAWGRGDTLASATAVRSTINANEVSYAHGNLTEWWRVLPMGFEQGFTIAKRPSGNGELRLALAMSPSNADFSLVRHSREGGNPVKTSPSIPLRSEGRKEIAWGKLRYGQLVVTDANGKLVPATFRVAQDRERARSHHAGERILIVVNDPQAVYPLTVDPLVWLDQKVTASDGAGSDAFGWSVALSGATALIGAPFATGNSPHGAAYAFSESNGSWTQTAKLTASDGAGGDGFGSSVALRIGGQKQAVIGAPLKDIGTNLEQGAAYFYSPNCQSGYGTFSGTLPPNGI